MRSARSLPEEHQGGPKEDLGLLGHGAFPVDHHGKSPGPKEVKPFLQRMRPAHEAGEKPNIVPRTAAASWYVRSGTVERLAELKERVVQCLAAGAEAAGCTMELHWVDPPYADMRDSAELLERYRAHAELLGRPFPDAADRPEVVGSTDMGDVSQVVPSIHPMLAVAPPGVSIHTPEFAAFARGAAGDRAVLDGARAMAATVLDCWADPLGSIPGGPPERT
mgnify:CR=1 FL=1